MGMGIMTRACVKMGTCPAECLSILECLLEKYHLEGTTSLDKTALLEASYADKKRRGSSITLIQPNGIGSCRLVKADYKQLEDILTLGL